GMVLSAVGGYLVLNQVQVTSSFTFFGLWGLGRPAGFGLTMLPMLIGVGVLFFDGKSKLGWILTVGGALTILAAVLMSLSIHWEATSLFNTLLMFGMLAAGLGLVARSFRPCGLHFHSLGRYRRGGAFQADAGSPEEVVRTWLVASGPHFGAQFANGGIRPGRGGWFPANAPLGDRRGPRRGGAVPRRRS